MKSLFELYFGLGFDHILDVDGYDHLLFLVALCAIYQLQDWRRVAILATSFTIGHSLTLGIAAFDIFSFPQNVVEFLIPVTILLTALFNVFFGLGNQPKDAKPNTVRKNPVSYFIALFFGFIHGMGFSNFFKSTTMPNQTSDLWRKLLSFNIGVEIGQLFIIFTILIISYLVMNVCKAKQRDWMLFVSGAAAGVSLILMMETKFW